MNRVSLEQARRAIEDGAEPVRVTPGEVFGDKAALRRIVAAASSALADGRNTVVHTLMRRDDETDYLSAAAASGVGTVELHGRIAYTMGRIVHGISEAVMGVGRTFTLSVFGGETAGAVLRALGCGLLRPVAEIQPGMTLSNAPTCPGLMAVVTKSGGFGTPDAIEAISRYVHKGRRTDGVE
jgi:uncharacterized protein YgbK (DUF1537 family)